MARATPRPQRKREFDAAAGMLCSSLMSEMVSADAPEPGTASKFELAVGKAKLSMENVTERVQLAAIGAAAVCFTTFVAYRLVSVAQSTPQDNESEQHDG